MKKLGIVTERKQFIKLVKKNLKRAYVAKTKARMEARKTLYPFITSDSKGYLKGVEFIVRKPTFEEFNRNIFN